MSRLTANGIYFSQATPPVTAVPFTVTGWIYLTTLPSVEGNEAAIWWLSDGSFSDFFLFRVNTSDQVQFNRRENNGSTDAATTTNTVSVDTWHHVCFIAASATDVTVILDGDTGNQGTSTANRVPIGITDCEVGRDGPTLNDYLIGRVAMLATWDVARSSSECVALSNGASPKRYGPDSLVQYLPFIEPSGNAIDYSPTGLNLTENGSSAYADGPPVQAPFGFDPAAAFFLAAVGGATNPKGPLGHPLHGALGGPI